MRARPKVHTQQVRFSTIGTAAPFLTIELQTPAEPFDTLTTLTPLQARVWSDRLRNFADTHAAAHSRKGIPCPR